MMTKIMDGVKRNILLVTASAAALIMLVFAGVVFYQRIVAPPAPPEPPIHYTQGEYLPERSVYAPGESFVYSPTLVIKTAGRIDVFRSFWDRTHDRNATLCSGGSAPTISIARNFPISTVGNVRGGSRVQLIVPPLPPGDYYLISSASGPNGGQSVYVVPFSIRREC